MSAQPSCLLILPPVRRRAPAAPIKLDHQWLACVRVDLTYRGETERAAVQLARDALAANLAEVDAYLASLPA